VEAELLGDEGTVAGRLDVTGGGVAFLPTGANGGFLIVPDALRGVGPARSFGTSLARMEPRQELVVHGDGTRHVVRVNAVDGWDLVMALVRERRAARLPDVPISTAAGFEAKASPGERVPPPGERGAVPRTIVEAELLDDGGPVAGRLDVRGGGIAFLPRGPRGGFAITTRGLTRVGPAARGSPDIAIEGDGVRHVLRFDPASASAFVAALADERRAAEAPEIPLVTLDGRRAPPQPPEDGVVAEPTLAERGGLAPDSLPGLWLGLTAGVSRIWCRHTDGMSMLLELALCGAIDAPTRHELVLSHRPTGDAAVDGALRRIDDRDLLMDPRGAASFLGPYVALLDADPSHAASVRAETREAFEEGPGYPRSALLLWLVKQDYVFRGVAVPLLFDDARRGRRLVRRSRPSIHVGDDLAATMRAHRVLASLIVQPGPGPGSMV
jgi:hypothetical protein